MKDGREGPPVGLGVVIACAVVFNLAYLIGVAIVVVTQ